ncbi:hypothetical protein [Chloroflexus sp.]|uniref:hypothetical protein n=1 Tax=Chloroflexus sp. TaxID=1904827 RepID=UPI002ACDF752|nr:hypothetical protein [Chloroflexus sp.]
MAVVLIVINNRPVLDVVYHGDTSRYRWNAPYQPEVAIALGNAWHELARDNSVWQLPNKQRPVGVVMRSLRIVDDIQ